MRKLEQTGGTETRSDENSPVTTKSLATDGGLEEILTKIEGTVSLEHSILTLGTTDLNGSGKSQATLNSSALSRLDTDPHLFLGRRQKADTKQGEKPFLIPDFEKLGIYMTISRKCKKLETTCGKRKTKI